MDLPVTLHPQYQHLEQAPQPLPLSLREHLDDRQDELRQFIEEFQGDPALSAEENAWLARSYLVLAVLSPVMSTNEDKIEFPGDPMILCAALTYVVDHAVTARQQGLYPSSPYNVLCPQWGYTPCKEYRRNMNDNGIRQYDAPLLNTDQTVFDPRVWNEKVRDFL